MAMAMQVALLTRWEWFKLRRRWVPWILLGFVMVVQQLIFWLAAVFSDGLFYQSTSENIANGLGFAALFGPFGGGHPDLGGGGRRIRLGNAAPGAEPGGRPLAVPDFQGGGGGRVHGGAPDCPQRRSYHQRVHRRSRVHRP